MVGRSVLRFAGAGAEEAAAAGAADDAASPPCSTDRPHPASKTKAASLLYIVKVIRRLPAKASAASVDDGR